MSLRSTRYRMFIADPPLLRTTMNRAADSRRDFTPEAGPVSGVHSRLYAGERTPTGGGRHDAVLPRHSPNRSPDGAQSREGRADLTQARRLAEYCGPARTVCLARATARLRSTGQNHWDEVLVALVLWRALSGAAWVRAPHSPWLGRQLRRLVLLVWWTVTLQLHVRVRYWLRLRRLRREAPSVAPDPLLETGDPATLAECRWPGAAGVGDRADLRAGRLHPALPGLDRAGDARGADRSVGDRRRLSVSTAARRSAADAAAPGARHPASFATKPTWDTCAVAIRRRARRAAAICIF